MKNISKTCTRRKQEEWASSVRSILALGRGWTTTVLGLWLPTAKTGRDPSLQLRLRNRHTGRERWSHRKHWRPPGVVDTDMEPRSQGLRPGGGRTAKTDSGRAA